MTHDLISEMGGRGQGAKPKRAKTHEENRPETCCCCGRKVTAQNGRKKITAITPKKAKQITDWAKRDWDPTVLSHPLGLYQMKAVVEYSSWNVFNITGTKRQRRVKDRSVK